MGLEDFQLLVPNVFASETINLDQLNFSGSPSDYSIDSIRLNYKKSNFFGSFNFNSRSSSKLTIQ